VPAKPSWFRRLPQILNDLRAHPHPYVDRATLELLLGVGRRRAQQILAPCVADRVGASGLASKEALLAHLEQIARGEEAFFEIRRRRQVARLLDQLRQQHLASPPLLVAAPAAVLRQTLGNLPAGVRIEPGRITVEFDEPHQALEKLLALAMAIGGDFEGFEYTAQL
jgi:hypothetical protein